MAILGFDHRRISAAPPKNFTFVWMLWLGLFFASSVASAATNTLKPVPPAPSQPAVVVDASVDKASATTSDTVTFSVTVKAGDAVVVEPLTGVVAMIKGFRVLDYGQDKPVKRSDHTEQTYFYKLQGDLSGSYVLPAITVNYTDATGAKKSAHTTEIFVELKAPQSSGGGKDAGNAEQVKDIRDIKGMIPYNMMRVWIAGGIIFIVVLLLGGCGYYFYRRAKNRLKPVVVVPAHEKALAVLSELRDSRLLERRDSKTFHFRLSEVLRGYVEERFGFPATDRTLEEIKRQISRVTALNKEHREPFVEILAHADLVKFTDHNPSIGESMQRLKDAVNFVENTRPYEEVKPNEQEQDSVV